MSISQKVMTVCVHTKINNKAPSSVVRQSSHESDDVFEDPPLLNHSSNANDSIRLKSPLDVQILQDWLQEATHQLTRPGANNTVRVAADNLLITLASKHGCFKEVCCWAINIITV